MNYVTFDILLWAIALMIGFPLLVISLGEFNYRLQRRSRSLATTFQVIRNLVLPVLFFLLFLQYVLKLPPDGKLIKSVETLFWLCLIHASLSLMNAILFEQAKADTWRAKVPKLLIDLSRLFLVTVGMAIVSALVWGADIAGLATALGVSSLVIGLALQDTLGSVMSGIALLFERPFAVGDWLQIGDRVGQVIDINWRSVRLQTFDREMVIIPHKVVGGEVVCNFSRPKPIQAERIQIGFSYSDPPNVAKQVLYNTALETQGILAQPEPQIFTLSYADFSITYEVKFFIEDYGELEEIRDRFMTRLWYAAQRNNLTIPFPIRTLYHYHGPTAQSQEASKKFAERMQSIPSFVPLDKPEISYQFSPDVLLQHFGTGEKVIRQNYPSDALYFIVSGQAIMTFSDETGQDYPVLKLGAGEFFGEMTLFSSDPSPISVVALDDLEIMMLSSNIVNQMIERQPSFAREISQILEVRRKTVQSTAHAVKEGSV